MRGHADRTVWDPAGGGWRAACKCGWAGLGTTATQGRARRLYARHRAWAQAALQVQVAKRAKAHDRHAVL